MSRSSGMARDQRLVQIKIADGQCQSKVLVSMALTFKSIKRRETTMSQIPIVCLNQ